MLAEGYYLSGSCDRLINSSNPVERHMHALEKENKISSVEIYAKNKTEARTQLKNLGWKITKSEGLLCPGCNQTKKPKYSA